MSKKRIFHTYPKHVQFQILLFCFDFAVKEASSNPSVLDKFKDGSGSKLFKLAAQYSKHVKPEDFEELKTITVYEIGRNIVSGNKSELEQKKKDYEADKRKS